MTLTRLSNLNLSFVRYAPTVERIRTSFPIRDDYKTIKVIGRGAFGEVHVVQHRVSSVHCRAVRSVGDLTTSIRHGPQKTDTVYAMKVLNKNDMIKRKEVRLHEV